MDPSTPALRVLVVDDNDDIRDVLTLMVERLGHVAQQARDGVEAVAVLESGDVDLMLLDLTMPRMSGQDVLRWLQQHPDIARDLRVVVISALAKERRLEVEALGAHAVLEKPVRVAELGQVISKTMSGETPHVSQRPA